MVQIRVLILILSMISVISKRLTKKERYQFLQYYVFRSITAHRALIEEPRHVDYVRVTSKYPILFCCHSMS